MNTTKIPTKPTKKRKTKKNPKTSFLINLQSCTKLKDLQTAISLFKSALSQNLRLSLHHFNALLYLCSNFATDPSAKDSAIDYGFRVFNHMLSNKAVPNEAFVTSIIRLASAKKDGDYAFELIKKMNKDYKPRALGVLSSSSILSLIRRIKVNYQSECQPRAIEYLFDGVPCLATSPVDNYYT